MNNDYLLLQLELITEQKRNYILEKGIRTAVEKSLDRRKKSIRFSFLDSCLEIRENQYSPQTMIILVK